ncbi:MAG: RagB/SusD family nutrient uptake outer membrane protein [Chitinophagaceae bacterium]
MRSLRFSIATVSVIIASVTFSGCKKLVEVTPEDVLDAKNAYQNVYDADAAVMGAYGKFMNLAPYYVVLNELRADLLTTTENSDEYLKQLNEHNVQTGNPYANPRPFYEVIANCNDVLYNFDLMLRDKKMKQAEYNMRYSDIAALRSWVYLQLGIHFGDVPYVTDPLSTNEDIRNVSLRPKVTFSQLLSNLIVTMESLPYSDPYSSSPTLITTVDGYNTVNFFVNKKALLGELYLWRSQPGDYRKAAEAFKNVMEMGGAGQLYNLRMTGASKADNNDIAVGYVRYREEDENMLVDNNSQGWRSIFARGQDALFNYEWIWFLPYDNTIFKPENPFINLFSNRGGSYLLKPSQYAANLWNSQVQKNDFPYDARGRVFSYRTLGTSPVAMKYLYNYLGDGFLPTSLLEKKGKWFLYRAAALHLEFAEAANRDDHHALADRLLNQGFIGLNINNNESYPYNFDGRKSDNPRIAADWCLNSGIRGRANLYSAPVVGDSTIALEDNIIREGALELAYEGKRWSDLLRVAMRRNDPAFLADKIYNKLLAENNGQAAAVRAKLMNKANWYLPFKWE